jgi:formylglycine-generating enzyme required for sulfatase activity
MIREIQIGEKIRDRFQIKSLAGRGSFSAVYKAWDLEKNENCAIKVYYPVEGHPFSDKADVVFELLLKLEHGNICRTFEWFKEGEVYYAKTEYIEGSNLRKLIKMRKDEDKPFTFEETAPIIEGVLDAIIYANHFLPHSYLKPEHIFILPKRILVTDFGIPYIYGHEVFLAKLVVEGDPYYYVPPEFVSKKGRVDRSGDVYSIGVILYEMLTGTIPKKDSPPPSEINPKVDEDVERLIMKALSPSPRERFRDAVEFKKEFLYLLDRHYERETEYTEEFVLFELIEEKERELEKLFEEEKPPAEVKPVEKEKKEIPVEKPVLPEEKAEKKRFPVLPVFAVFIFLFLAFGGYLFLGQRGKRGKEIVSPPVVVKIEEPAEEKKKENVEEKLPPQEKKEEVPKEGEGEKKEGQVLEEKKEPPQTASLPEKKEIPQKEVAPKKKKEEKVAQEVSPVKEEKCPKGMIYIPAGEFLMGSPSDDPLRDIGEKKLQRVFVDDFCIDIYEFPNQKGKKPMTNVTYEEAKAECEKAGKRLCTEEEWEKACKGANFLRYPYGNNWDPNACATEDARGVDRALSPSGAFPECKSSYGVYDMSGNLWEWTSTVFMKGLNDMVLKGGAFTSPDYASRCAYRYSLPPEERSPETGFRCCKGIKK